MTTSNFGGAQPPLSKSGGAQAPPAPPGSLPLHCCSCNWWISDSGIDYCSNCHCDSGLVIKESQRTLLPWNTEVVCDNKIMEITLHQFLLYRGQMSAVDITTKSNEVYELSEEPTYVSV